jgi:hypothetical protein
LVLCVSEVAVGSAIPDIFQIISYLDNLAVTRRVDAISNVFASKIVGQPFPVAMVISPASGAPALQSYKAFRERTRDSGNASVLMIPAGIQIVGQPFPVADPNNPAGGALQSNKAFRERPGTP